MALNVNFNGTTIFKPGAFSKTNVNLSGVFQLAPTGIVAIVGESEGGEPSSSSGILSFTSEDIAALVSIYKSGPIVDAARLLVAPARDPRVANGAGLIRVYKTNASARSSAVFKNVNSDDLFTISSANFGVDENLIKVKIEAGANPAARHISITKSGARERLSENPSDTWMSLQYTGINGSAVLTIQAGTLSVDAGGADDLSIPLAGKSLQDLVVIIDGYAV